MQTEPEGKTGRDWRCLGVDKYTSVSHSFQTFLRYGWMDKFFINPIWDISVKRKIAGLIFSTKTNMQDLVRGWSCFGSLLPMPFKQRWQKTCWVLHSQSYWFPADLAPKVMQHTSSLGQLAKTPYIIHDSSIQHTHTYLRLEEISPEVENYDDTRELCKGD